MMYNSLCVGAELRERRFNHLINGSTNVLFYNTVIIVHYVLTSVQSVRSRKLAMTFLRDPRQSEVDLFHSMDIALAQIFG